MSPMSVERYEQLKSMIVHYLDCPSNIELKTDAIIENLDSLSAESHSLMDRFMQTKTNLSVLKGKAMEYIETIEKEKWETEPVIPPPFFD